MDLVNSVKEDEKDGDVDVKVKIAPNELVEKVKLRIMQSDYTKINDIDIASFVDETTFNNLVRENTRKTDRQSKQKSLRKNAKKGIIKSNDILIEGGGNFELKPDLEI